jgi:hypothetical protein
MRSLPTWYGTIQWCSRRFFVLLFFLVSYICSLFIVKQLDADAAKYAEEEARKKEVARLRRAEMDAANKQLAQRGPGGAPRVTDVRSFPLLFSFFCVHVSAPLSSACLFL